MNLLQAIFMGLIQGLTEFLPVSSSGHLAIFQQLFGIKTDTGVLFEVLLHLGTLIAVCIVFWKDFKNLVIHGIEGKHYNKVSDNVVKTVENAGYAPNAAWVFGNQFNAYYMEGQQEGIWEETDSINRNAARSLYRGFTVDFSKIKSDVAKLSAVENEYKYLELGTEDPEQPLQEFIQKLKSAGLDEVYAEVQAQMNEFLANQQ